MAVPKDINDALNEQTKGWTPQVQALTTPAGEPLANEPRAEAGWSLGRSLAEFGGDIGAALRQGVAQGADFSKGVIAGTLMPIIPEGDTSGAQAIAALLRPSTDFTTASGAAQRAEEPKTFGGALLNPAAKGVGSMATMPMPGGIARNVIAGMGMGEGAQWGGKLLEGVFDYFGGPEARQAGKATGEILGGGVGAQANVARAKAMALAGQSALTAPRAAMDAYQSAKGKYGEAMSAYNAAGGTGDKPRLWSIFADEFGSLRAKTQGIVEQYTNAILADAIRRDIKASGMAKDFASDITTTGIDPKNWGLPEWTMVPALTRMAAQRGPRTFAESEGIEQAASGRKQDIIDAYNRLMGRKLPATAQGAQAAAQAMQQITQAKVNALGVEQEGIKSSFPDLNPQTRFALGEQAREVRDNLAQQSKDVAKGKYAAAAQAFDTEGVQIPLGSVRQEAKDILNEFVAQADPQAVPPVVRSILGATAPKEAAALPGLILPEELAAKRAAANAPKEKTVSLADANDLVVALSTIASRLRQAEGRAVDFNRAVKMKNEVLDAISGSKASEEAKALYADARNFWATDYAPRFNEGLGKALGRERGGVMEGREAITSENVYDQFLNPKNQETSLREFDRIYGNNPQAAAGLQASLAGRFRDTLSGAKTVDALESAVNGFRTDNAAALARMPQLADRIDQQSARMLGLMKEQEREIGRYKQIMGSPITEAIGPVQAKTMFQNALNDPLKMEDLLRKVPRDAAPNLVKELFLQAHPFKNGEYSPEALHDLLYAGKNSPMQKSSMEKLFTAAFGPEGGKEHFDTLEAIANFTKREAATNPQNLRPNSLLSDAPIQEATGQRLASWISAWRATQVGAAGSTFFTMLGLSRFANAKAQAAVEAAKMKALYDPATATAILEMAATPSTSPISATSLRKVFGDLKAPNGQNMVDYLIDRGYGKQYGARGMAYGIEQTQEDRRKGQPMTTARKLDKPLGYVGTYPKE